MIAQLIEAVRSLEEAKESCFAPIIRKELDVSIVQLRKLLAKQGVFIGTQIGGVERVLKDEESTASPWCPSCGSWHDKPISKAHHKSLQCMAKWPARK